MNCLMSFTVWEWLNFDTSLVPSARRIWMEVVGSSGSRGTQGRGGAAAEVEEPLELAVGG